MRASFVKHLNDQAAEQLLQRLLVNLAKFQRDSLGPQAAKVLLQTTIEYLDIFDEEDFFGTEGWRHALGFDDDLEEEEEE